MSVKCDFCASRTKETITVYVQDDSYGWCDARLEVCPKCGKKYLEDKKCVENEGLHMEAIVPKCVFSKAIRDYLSTL